MSDVRRAARRRELKIRPELARSGPVSPFVRLLDPILSLFDQSFYCHLRQLNGQLEEGPDASQTVLRFVAIRNRGSMIARFTP